MKSHNQNNRTPSLTWVVLQKIKEIFIIVLPKKKAGELEVLSSYYILMRNSIFFQVDIECISFTNISNCRGEKSSRSLCSTGQLESSSQQEA